eukprot:1157721-Alexandrium_andersonii.AAC.1
MLDVLDLASLELDWRRLALDLAHGAELVDVPLLEPARSYASRIGAEDREGDRLAPQLVDGLAHDDRRLGDLAEGLLRDLLEDRRLKERDRLDSCDWHRGNPEHPNRP